VSLWSTIESLFKSPELNLTGTWSGGYGYGNQYPIIMRENTVSWVAKINQKNLGKFSGTIKEDENGIPETSEITGVIKGHKLVFIKTYKNSYEVDESGNHIVKPGPQQVTYSGLYDKYAKKFTGIWTIATVYRSSDGKEFEHTVSGSWEMSQQTAATSYPISHR
jgi:hypothetical protein